MNCPCLSCLVHSHMLVPAVTFSPQAPRSADPTGTAEVSAPLGKVSEWIVLAFRCTVRFLPEAALLISFAPELTCLTQHPAVALRP